MQTRYDRTCLGIGGFSMGRTKYVTPGDVVFIDIETCELTLKEVMDQVNVLIEEHPDMEIFMDGDAYAIVGRPKKVQP